MPEQINERVDQTGWTAEQRRAHRNKNRRAVYKVKKAPSKIEKYERERDLIDKEEELKLHRALDDEERDDVGAIAMDKVIVKLDTPEYNRRASRAVDGRAELIAERVNKKRRAEVPTTPQNPQKKVVSDTQPQTSSVQKPEKGLARRSGEKQRKVEAELPPYTPPPSLSERLMLPPGGGAFDQLTEATGGRASILNGAMPMSLI